MADGTPRAHPSPPAATTTIFTPQVLAALGAIWVIWGSTYFAIKVAVATVPPLIMSSTRYLLAGALMTAWVVLSGEWSRNKPKRSEILTSMAVGVALISIGNGTMSWLGGMVPSGVLALLTCFTPIFMVVGDRLISGIPMGAPRALGLLLGLVGSMWLVAPGKELRIAGWPLAVLLFASLSWTGASLWSRTAKQPRSNLVANAIQMCTGGFVTLVGSAIKGEWAGFDVSKVTAGAWLSIAYLVVFGSLIAFTAYTWLLKTVPVHIVATHQYVNPVVAVAIGIVVAREAVEPALLGAGTLVVIAIALIFAPRRV